MNYETWPNLPAMFFEQAGKLADKPFLWTKRDGVFQPMAWREVEAAVKALSVGLRGLGVKPGDRVVLVSENRPEWLIADVAILAAGAITVPAYVTNTTADHAHILNNSGAVGAIVSSRQLAARLLPAATSAEHCRWLVSIEPPEPPKQNGLELHTWDGLLGAGRDLAEETEPAVVETKREDIACFIYTSGTGGIPKGVMLSHGNILANCKSAYHLLEEIGLGDEVFLSFLPLSHSYEHTAGQFFPISIGAEIYYAEGVEHLLTNLSESRPTIMTAVPRLYEMMHQRILRGVEKAGGLKQMLFELAVKLGQKMYHAPGSLRPLERIQDTLVERLVRDKMRARFGGRLKAMVSGGAALNPDIGIFFTALGLPVLQGYGQTEAAPVVSANPPGRAKMHTVGPPLEGVEVKIADDGEILVRGELVMKGYWQDEQATAEALRDGWLHTGDIGQIDEDGYLQITDRKKDIIVLSGGDNVSPARIEGMLTLQPELAQAMVYGDRRPHLVVLVVPDEEFLRGWAKEQGKAPDLAELCEDAELRAALGAAVDRVNGTLSNIEKLRRYVVAPEAFSVDNEMLTPTLKIRRHKIKEVYGAGLEALY